VAVPHLLLFDIDGVLVEARGYLRALRDTVAYFSRQMGVGDHPPTEEEVRVFEANGLTSEWDSAPTCVAALLVERLRRGSSLPLPFEWPEALALLAAHPLPLPHPDYAALARMIGEQLAGQTGAAQAARAVLWERARAIPGVEPSLPAISTLLDTLLGHTHDFYRAPVTRHFQHLAIGSRAVAATYGVSPEFECPAYLEQFDRPSLAPDIRDRLVAAAKRGHVRMALYTARPSLPPTGADEPANGYSPEAEMARSLVALALWPLIGLGRMRWLARRVGDEVENLVKPSPVQALAAIGAAWSGQEIAALRAALALHRKGELCSPLADLGAVTLDIFEDTPGGLAAVEGGVEALRAAGVDVTWRPYGIASSDGPKTAALAARGVPIYPSVNEAVLDALEHD
jgi:hypothetical protein